MKRTLVLRNILLTCIVALFCMSTFAQSDQRNIRNVLFVHVKLDQQDAWKAAVKELVAVYRKAGVDNGFTIWHSQTGVDQFAVVWYWAKWQEMDTLDPKLKSSQAAMDAIFKKLNACTYSTETWIDEIQPDMRISSAQMPKLVRTARTQIAPGKMEEAKALFRDQLYPAYKKAGVADFGVAVGRYGTTTNEIHTYVAVNSWADFDSPFGAQKAMSADEWKSFQEKLSTVVTGGTEFTVWEFQPDLSYIPKPAK